MSCETIHFPCSAAIEAGARSPRGRINRTRAAEAADSSRPDSLETSGSHGRDRRGHALPPPVGEFRLDRPRFLATPAGWQGDLAAPRLPDPPTLDVADLRCARRDALVGLPGRDLADLGIGRSVGPLPLALA